MVTTSFIERSETLTFRNEYHLKGCTLFKINEYSLTGRMVSCHINMRLSGKMLRLSARIQWATPIIPPIALYLLSIRLNSNKLNGSFVLEITDMLHPEQLRSFSISEFHGADCFPFLYSFLLLSCRLSQDSSTRTG